jgi:CHU_C Type IX secretion signal domain
MCLSENAKFIVRALGITSVKSFRVFNRWGKIMFERNNFPPNNPDFSWDGMFNGKFADPGVYVYRTEVICQVLPTTFVLLDIAPFATKKIMEYSEPEQCTVYAQNARKAKWK